MIRLVFISSGGPDQSCELPDGTFTVGRTVNNSLRIQEESVSGRHCELLVYGSELIVRECGSRNGTYVDNVRVQGQCGVRNGQIIRFGRVAAGVQVVRPLEFRADDVSTVQGLLHVSTTQREVPREWAVTPTPPRPRG